MDDSSWETIDNGTVNKNKTTTEYFVVSAGGGGSGYYKP